MSKASLVNMDQYIKEYAEHLMSGGHSLNWAEIFDSEYYTSLEVLEYLIESHILFSGKDSITNYPDQLEAFDQITQSCLQDILIQLREGRALAKEYWLSLQSYLEKAVGNPNSESYLLSRLILQISDLGFQFNDQLLEKSREWMEKIFESEVSDESVSLAMSVNMDGLVGELFMEDEIKDEFGFFEAFSNQIAYLKLNTLSEFFIQVLHSNTVELKEAVALFLLHPQPCVRQQTISVFSLLTSLISPLSLYRMIRVRNWLPELEKKSLDAIILAAKKMSIIPSEVTKESSEGRVEAVKHLASTVDGAGSQNILSLFKIGNEFQIYAGVIKEKVGWIDLWSTPLTTRKECDATLRKIRESLFAVEVNSDFLKSVIPMGLAWNKQSEVLAHPLLVSWAERLKLEDVNPQETVTPTIFNYLLEKSPRVLDRHFQNNSLTKSRSWLTSKEFASGWFESSESTESHLDNLLGFLEKYGEQKLDDHEVVDQIVKTLIGPEREKWSNRFVRLAYWASENTKKRGPNWEDFLVLAILLRENMPLENIPIMREMGVCTLSFYLPSKIPSQ